MTKGEINVINKSITPEMAYRFILKGLYFMKYLTREKCLHPNVFMPTAKRTAWRWRRLSIPMNLKEWSVFAIHCHQRGRYAFDGFRAATTGLFNDYIQNNI